MAYYSLLNFENEPFSNTPDPRLFYHSRQHLEILQKLEISIRLKRGLNLVIGDVGTGKTTLSRQLIRKIQNDETVNHHLILDPGFDSARDFLAHLTQLFLGQAPKNSENETQLKEGIKNHLFTRFVEGGINTVLLIDEGQKASLPILEALRELLNFETNDEKLLQIIIFAQNEFASLLEAVENFQDRINFQYSLSPLGFMESKGLIQYRLNQSFVPGKAEALFTGSAYWAIYRRTKGSPRKMVNLCHQVILAMIIQKKKKAGFFLVQSCVKKKVVQEKRSLSVRRIALGALIIAALVSGFYAGQNYVPKINGPIANDPGTNSPVLSVQKKVPKRFIPILSASGYTNSSIGLSATEDSPPGYGRALVPPDVTVFRMIHRVYGQFSDTLLSQLMASNPGINSPEHVLAGMDLVFPVSEFAKPIPRTGIFPVFLETRDFSQAFSKALDKEYTKNTPVRILATPLSTNDFLFRVILDHSFDTQSQGRIFMGEKYPDFSPNFVDMVSLGSKQFSTKGSAL